DLRSARARACRSDRPPAGIAVDRRSAPAGNPEAGNPLDRGFDLVGGDQPRALELTRRVLVAGAPQEIPVVEPHPDVVPTGTAGVIIDHPVGSIEFVGRVRKSRKWQE